MEHFYTAVEIDVRHYPLWITVVAEVLSLPVFTVFLAIYYMLFWVKTYAHMFWGSIVTGCKSYCRYLLFYRRTPYLSRNNLLCWPSSLVSSVMNNYRICRDCLHIIAVHSERISSQRYHFAIICIITMGTLDSQKL